MRPIVCCDDCSKGQDQTDRQEPGKDDIAVLRRHLGQMYTRFNLQKNFTFQSCWQLSLIQVTKHMTEGPCIAAVLTWIPAHRPQRAKTTRAY